MSVEASNALSAIPQAGSSIAGVIQRAASATGASFDYLLATAKVESNLKPELKAKTSSATGLFQFIEQTWLAMIKQTGDTLGFGRYADAISRTSSGRYQVADPAMRNEILQLRTDAAANAAMAGAFTQQNASMLKSRIGREPTHGELYAAHFFGPAGAAKLIQARESTPGATAAQIFPSAAAANRSIFYDRQGQARSVSGVYDELNRRFQVARASTVAVAARQVAAEPAVASFAANPAAAVSDTAGTTMAFAAATTGAQSVAPPTPVFRSLFQTDQPRGPVSAVVADLWSNGPAHAQASGASTTQPGAPLNLFQDINPDVRSLFQRSA